MRDGLMHNAWEQCGAFVTILQLDSLDYGLGVNWLIFDAVLLSSLKAKSVVASLWQDPFKEVRVIWILHEEVPGKELWLPRLASKDEVLLSYRTAFERADVVLLSDYVLAMKYSKLDSGNFFVLPGSPVPEFTANEFMSSHSREEVRGFLNLSTRDVAVAVVGSPFSYKSVWREHALVMQAIFPLAKALGKDGVSMRLMIYSVGSTSGYSRALQVHDGIPICIFEGGDSTDLARALKKALTQSGVIGSAHASMVHRRGKGEVLSVAKVISGFADFLEAVIEFPSEVDLPLPISLLSEKLGNNWQWELLKPYRSYSAGDHTNSSTLMTSPIVAHQKDRLSGRPESNSGDAGMISKNQDSLTLDDWVEFRLMKLVDEMEQSEEEQLKERNEQLHGTWEEVYRSVRKAENMKNDLHERDDGELERTGQPICIYEPYIGAGTWSLLGEKSILYRGISLNPKQRRPGSDDIEAPLRLPLLNHSYYRDVLCEFGAFFAIANHIDRIHKNAWIGVQSWQSAGRKVSLSSNAELALSDAVQGGNNGDAVYFWASTDLYSNQGSLQRDFWSLCDAINNGNCRSVFLKTLRDMFGLPLDWNLLPPMPVDGDSWSALHSWAMPTSSFLEFIMFSRMFVSSLDLLSSEQHGKCSLGISTIEVKHCYCRLLELLINVWVYHSARRMVFLDPTDGSMHEQHNLSSRHGLMWVNFFSYKTLKAMDEDLAEEADDGTTTNKRWIWPRTGEVFCPQIHDRERKQRYTMKLEKKKRDKERVRRIRSRQRQRPLARG